MITNKQPKDLEALVALYYVVNDFLNFVTIQGKFEDGLPYFKIIESELEQEVQLLKTAFDKVNKGAE